MDFRQVVVFSDGVVKAHALPDNAITLYRQLPLMTGDLARFDAWEKSFTCQVSQRHWALQADAAALPLLVVYVDQPPASPQPEPAPVLRLIRGASDPSGSSE